MLDLTEVFFNIENISNKDIILFGSYRLRPGAKADLFKVIPNLSESRIIDALRSPSGELFVFSELQKKIIIHDFRLTSLDSARVGAKHIVSNNVPERGKVLGFDGAMLKWVSGGGGHFDVEAPLVREADTLRIDRAGPHTSGYLSKEDWLAFSNITTGFRIWQYYDLPANIGVKCKIASFNTASIPFNTGSIVNGSAVIVNASTLSAPGKSRWKILGSKSQIVVTQHIGDEVLLSAAPKAEELCRLYFLVCLPAGVDVPDSYSGAPDYVRQLRAEYFDFIDLNSSKTELINGTKTFKSPVIFESDQQINQSLTVAGKITAHSITLNDAPQSYHVLTSSAMGSGTWQANPTVSQGPPLNCYDGQLWVRTPDFELFVYDGTRTSWLSVAERSISAWSTQTLAHMYLAQGGGSTCNILPLKSTLVGMVASSSPGSSWTAEVHINNSIIPGAFIKVGEDGRGFSNNLSVPFNQGDRIQFFVNGHMIDNPKIEAIFKKSF
jgi:hypothetical protein